MELAEPSRALLVLAAFALVALRSLQQQNVIHRYYWWAAATSYVIAFADIALILFVVKTGWGSAVYIGTGGAIGVTFAMYVHRRFIHKV
jgi:hypothetical protein